MKYKNLSAFFAFTCLITWACQNESKETVSKEEKEITSSEWALRPFVRPTGVNPVISPDSTTVFHCPMSDEDIAWESNDTFNPAATVMGDSIYVLYRAEDKSGVGIGERTSRIGLASSPDGYTINRRTKPVLFPADDTQKDNEWPGGCEDPRVAVTEDGTYVMLYTQWNKQVPRLAVATSTNLLNWEKHGPAFEEAYEGKYKDRFSKSASIITQVKSNKKVITKVKGKYWMYWGEKNIYAATSDDLINWNPVEDENGQLKALISPRKGYFDSQLTEAGPPAIVSDHGIVLMYNGKNLADGGDTTYTANTYCAGQVLFDKEDPVKVLDRLEKPFLVPSEPFEKSGQYPAGTVFIEGLVFFNNQYYLYYGCADSRVAVAIYTP